MTESYQCTVKVCGLNNDMLVGVIWWNNGYMPFASFVYPKRTKIPRTNMIKPELLGSYQIISFEGVDTDLNAVKPRFVESVNDEEDDEDQIYFDLSIYEAWLRKKKKPIPEVLDKTLFTERIKADRKKAYFKLAQTQMEFV